MTPPRPNESEPVSGTADPAGDQEALRFLVEGTASFTGEEFFRSLVLNLAKALGVAGAWVAVYDAARRHMSGLAFRYRDRWIDGYEYDLDGTPCEPAVEKRDFFHVPDSVADLFPKDADLRPFSARSYMAMPLLDADGSVLAHLAVIDDRPHPDARRSEALLRIFAARASAEFRRLRAERELRESEARLRRLVEGAMDALIEIDAGLTIAAVNPGAERVFACPATELTGRNLGDFLSPESRARVARLAASLPSRPEGSRSLWIHDGLQARRSDGAAFAAEATLSCSEVGPRSFYTLILRDVNDRLAAERMVESLVSETQYLREEIDGLLPLREIVGESPAIRLVLHSITQVAQTNAAVLIQGETGTGKELIARAVHEASARRSRPFVKVNCGAIPANLIESEFFGHEAGAFTGATKRRDGRFALADGGTLFLDEIGELPLDLQVKLLRVLQEGEFEPVGSSRTRKVDVRIVAATNRNLGDEVKAGRFRQDLYFRLDVFPIVSPPLRERGEDVILLAEVLVRQIGQRMHRSVAPLSESDCRRLRAYDWPGNVRELQNVIERALITSRDGTLHLDRFLPREAVETSAPEGAPAMRPPATATVAPLEAEQGPVRTQREMEVLERLNLERALAACGGRVAGPGGAAELLGVHASTLRSRMKALGISPHARRALPHRPSTD